MFLVVTCIKTRKNTRKSEKVTPKGAEAAIKHVQNAYFCDLYVFLRVVGHLAGEGSSGKGG